MARRQCRMRVRTRRRGGGDGLVLRRRRRRAGRRRGRPLLLLLLPLLLPLLLLLALLPLLLRAPRECGEALLLDQRRQLAALHGSRRPREFLRSADAFEWRIVGAI